MKYLIAIIFTFIFLSCSDNNKKENKVHSISKRPNSKKTDGPKTDKIIFFDVDDYPVTDDMLKDKTSDNSMYLKKVNEVYSLEKAWFTNDDIRQTLVFQLYTDYHRMEIYHFKNDDIPKSLIEKMELSIAGETNSFKSASNEQKHQSFEGFIKLSEKINQRYFTTIKGIRLYENEMFLIKRYGNPDKTLKEDDYEIYEWSFPGEYNLFGDFAEKSLDDLEKNTVAKKSFGNKVTAYFRDHKLIAQIIENDIP